MTRYDYFLGKLGIIAALVAAVAVIPAVLAYALGICFSLDLSVARDTWRLLPASVVYGLLIVVSAGTLMLAMSSMSRRSLYVGLAWIGMWLIGNTVALALAGMQEEMIWNDVRQAQSQADLSDSMAQRPGHRGRVRDYNEIVEAVRRRIGQNCQDRLASAVLLHGQSAAPW